MPIRQIANTHAYVTTVGAGDDPALFFHCSLAHHGAGSEMYSELTENFTVKAFDLPGHGRSSDWDGQLDYQTLVCDVATQLCDGPTHLIGHSFGATAALRVACEHPDLVSKLTLIEPVYFAAARLAQDPEFTLHEASFAPFAAAMEVGDREGAARVFTQMWGTGEAWDDIPQRQRQYIVDRIHLIVATAPAIDEDNAGLLSSGALEAIRCPVTLVEGSKSPKIIQSIHSALCGRIAHAQRVVVIGAGHMSPVTHPKQVAAIIRG